MNWVSEMTLRSVPRSAPNFTPVAVRKPVPVTVTESRRRWCRPVGLTVVTVGVPCRR